MGQQRADASKRTAQHILAREIVELAHGAAEAKQAETAHKEAFSHGTNTYSLGALRSTLNSIKPTVAPVTQPDKRKRGAPVDLIAHKKAYIAASSGSQTPPSTTKERPKSDEANVVSLPLSMLQPGSFPRILHAAGLASSKSDAHRLIASKGAYVVVPNSGSINTPTALQWVPIEGATATADPNLFLIDFEALVLRSGKSKIQICRIVADEALQREGSERPGEEEIVAKSDGDSNHSA
jgi:tyrosyl-tRNA synthetase